jgi:hypothetical protein
VLLVLKVLVLVVLTVRLCWWPYWLNQYRKTGPVRGQPHVVLGPKKNW